MKLSNHEQAIEQSRAKARLRGREAVAAAEVWDVGLAAVCTVRNPDELEDVQPALEVLGPDDAASS